MLSEHVDLARLGELARKGVGMAQCLSAKDLVRLSACTLQAGAGQQTDESVELTADVRFDVGPEGFPRVSVAIKGHLSLQCQRCLEPLAWPVRIETCLSVLDDEEQTELIASPYDSVLINADGLNLVEVIEDEILAALPMVPVHEDGPNCRSACGADNNSTIDAELKQRPFADLVSLVGSRKSEVDD